MSAPSENSSNAPAPPPPVQLMQLLMGGWISKSLSVVAKLKVSDHLADGPLGLAELAQKTDTHDESLGRILRMLSSVGVYSVDGDGRYALTPTAELLRTDVPGSLNGIVELMGHDSHWNAWGNLEHSVRTGAPAFDHTFGTDFFTYAAANPETQRTFNDAMTSLASASHSAIAAAYDFSGIDTLMDVGGGHGALLASILNANPTMRGVLFDLPHVVEGALALFEKQSVAGRATCAGGDFFADGHMPAGVDACILSCVIHDWDDDRSLKILRNCHAATREGGKLLLGELVVPGGPEPAPGKFMDLNMLVMTPGGRERTEAEYARLLEQSGYKLTGILPTVSATCIVEAVRI